MNHVIITVALLGHQTSHSQCNFFFPSCTIYYFLLSGHKLHFIVPCGVKKSIFLPSSRKKNHVQHGKNIYFTRVIVAVALLGHQTSHSQYNFFP